MADRTLNLELHCHTVYSMDGLITLDSLVRTAARVGLDAVAVTDHDTIEGALELRRRVKERGESLQVIVGEERTLADGSHLIGLFLERPIVAREPAEAVREIEEQGGLCLVPHPFRRKDGLLRDGLERLRLFEGRVAGFEIFSAKCSAAENARAAGLLTTGLGPFGGSDAHYECDLGESLNSIAWCGDLRESVRRMLERRSPCRILGKAQAADEGERAYAPLYYRVRKFIRLPKVLVPAAKCAYRRYRNWKFGVGPKPLREIYRHA